MPTSRNIALVPRAVERRLLLSYVAVFGAILLAFGVVAHAVFVVLLQREALGHLDTLIRTGESVIDPTHDGFRVDLHDETIASLNARTEGLQWYGIGGTLVAAAGLPVPAAMVREAPRALDQGVDATRQPTWVAAHATTVGVRPLRRAVIVAVVSQAPYRREQYTADVGILAAFLIAVVTSVVAGRCLTLQAMRPIDAAMRRIHDFTADAAHEFRGPLTAVATSARNVTAQSPNSVVMKRETIDCITAATSQMSRLCDDLLTLARAEESLERELFVVELGEVVHRVRQIYAQEAQRKGIALEVVTCDAIRMFGNPEQVDRIVGNLVQNAIRFTERGGHVALECVRNGNSAEVVVTDTGPGLRPGDMQRVFDRFWRGEAARGRDGSGLGLTIARELARRHGGDVRVASQLGVGSAFTVSFPFRFAASSGARQRS